MGERKVLNKYIPPDFDPARLPRMRRPEQGKMDVTMMLPMSIQCKTCGNFMYKGTKFNSKKEDVEGESYLGIKIFRLTMKCPRCTARFSLKTDPKNADYIVESGASRNYEPKKEDRQQIDQATNERKSEEELNAIRALENRTEDSRRQLELLDELDELRTLRAQHALLDLRPDRILALRDGDERPSISTTTTGTDGKNIRSLSTGEGIPDGYNEEEEEDALLAQQIFAQKQQELSIKRLKTEDNTTPSTVNTITSSSSSSSSHSVLPLNHHNNGPTKTGLKPISSLPSSIILVKKNTHSSSTSTSSSLSTVPPPSPRENTAATTTTTKRSRNEFEQTNNSDNSASYPSLSTTTVPITTSLSTTTSNTSLSVKPPVIGLVSYDSSSDDNDDDDDINNN